MTHQSATERRRRGATGCATAEATRPPRTAPCQVSRRPSRSDAGTRNPRHPRLATRRSGRTVSGEPGRGVVDERPHRKEPRWRFPDGSDPHQPGLAGERLDDVDEVLVLDGESW